MQKNKPVTIALETKTFPFQVKAIDTDQGTIRGYLSVFNNVDLQKDRVRPGAYRKSIQDGLQRKNNKGRKYLWPLLWMHDPEKPIGGIVDATEDKTGLLITAQLDISTNEQGIPLNPLATSIFSGFKQGYIDELSVGYKALQKSYDEGGVRNLLEMQIFEGSAVTMLFAANEAALVDTVKTASGHKGKGMDRATKDFNDYYRMRQIADWADKWSSLVNALKSAVLDAFNVGDMPASDIEAALNGGEGSPGFIAALMDWAQEGVNLDVSNYMKQPDVDALSGPQGVGYTALGYMSNDTALEVKKGAAISKDSAARLSGHTATLGLATKAINSVVDDMLLYITGGQAPFTDGGAQNDIPGSQGSGKVASIEPSSKALDTDNQPGNTDFVEMVTNWLLEEKAH